MNVLLTFSLLYTLIQKIIQFGMKVSPRFPFSSPLEVHVFASINWIMASRTNPPLESVITSQLLDQLSHTQYASISLTRLSGGFSNFTFRAKLLQLHSDGSDSVVIKYSAPHLAMDSSFALDAARSASSHL